MGYISSPPPSRDDGGAAPGGPTLFVKTTDDCSAANAYKPGNKGCYPGSDFLQNQIASDPGLAQRANWNDLNALVGTMADQIVAGIC